MSLDDYALKLKSLSDELRDLEFPIDDKIMLSTLSAGLGEDLSNAASNLTLLATPTFEQAVAYLRLEERRLKHLRARAAHTAFVAASPVALRLPPRAPASPLGSAAGFLQPVTRPARPAPGPARTVPAGQTGPGPPCRAPAGQTGPWTGQRPFRRWSPRPSSPWRWRQWWCAGAPAPRPSQHTAPPWTAGHNPWTGVVHAYSMPVPRAPTRHHGAASATHQAFSAPSLPGLRRPPGRDSVGSRAPDRPPERPLRARMVAVATGSWAPAHMAAHPERSCRTDASYPQRLRPHPSFHASMPPRFWPDALATATLVNIRPCRVRWSYTPHQLLYGVPPAYDDLRIFGCRCYPNTAATAAHKLAPRSLPCVFLGYPANTKGYRCYDPVSHRVITSRHVYFDELVFPFQQGLGDTSDDAPGARWPSCGRAPATDHGGPLCAGPVWSLGVSVAFGAPGAPVARGALGAPVARGASVAHGDPGVPVARDARGVPGAPVACGVPFDLGRFVSCLVGRLAVRLATRRCGPCAHAHPRTCGRATAVYTLPRRPHVCASSLAFRPAGRRRRAFTSRPCRTRSDRFPGRVTPRPRRPCRRPTRPAAARRLSFARPANRARDRPTRSAARSDRLLRRRQPGDRSFASAHLGSRCLTRPALACRHAGGIRRAAA
ncbi:hypothetical protein QYE76_064015 [Lolium multiflorum]|uniref:Retroviral polymerase SH3-like domain-containing protein n=1 Tax=Lolium multiflorum TaxID=4521 RepID=A0AAD8S6Q9_LOLMU|nr:hypothetical protein QYE76_064015 [Lolium multiflorum]